MKQHLEAIAGLLPPHLTVYLWAPPPGWRLPYLCVEAPSWGADPTPCMCGSQHTMATDIRIRAAAGTPDGVHTILAAARHALPGPLTVPGRLAELNFARSEYIGVDTDATIPDTNRHPAYGVDTYHLTSIPGGTP